MKKFSQRMARFFLRNRDRGIPNLMLYLSVAGAIVYILTIIDPSMLLYRVLCFDRTAILQGQVWRLVTFLVAHSPDSGAFGALITLLMLFFYYRIGLMLEQRLGICKFNLFYLTGVILMDLAGLLFGWYVTVDSLNLSLILAFAVLYSEAQVLLFYIIPIKMKYLAWFYLAITAQQCLMTRSLLPVIPLLSFLLFFWEDLPSLLPPSWRYRKPKNYRQTPPRQRPSANWAAGYQKQTGAKSFRHKCTVCGRTDAEFPHLEFRYCSRCSGYRCYCIDHINNHAHIVE